MQGLVPTGYNPRQCGAIPEKLSRACTLVSVNQSQDNTENLPKGYTPKKGRPTPKRKEAERHAGNFEARFAPQQSWSESRKEKKELKASMSSEEWKEYKAKQKEQRKQRQREAQAGMDRGEEQYLLDRDRGPEKRFLRDFVDSRRYASNFVMPVALLLLVVLFVGQWAPTFASIASMAAMLMMLAFLVEGIVLGRAASRATREKFPDTKLRGSSMGFYAYSRATQPRRWRTPKPRVELGQKVV